MGQLNGKARGKGDETLDVNLSSSEAASGVQKIIRQSATIRVQEEQHVSLLNVIPVSVADPGHLADFGGSNESDLMLKQARSLVHSLNNQLSIILTYSDITLLAAPPPPELSDDLQIIKSAGEKAADLVRQLHKVFEG